MRTRGWKTKRKKKIENTINRRTGIVHQAPSSHGVDRFHVSMRNRFVGVSYYAFRPTLDMDTLPGKRWRDTKNKRGGCC